MKQHTALAETRRQAGSAHPRSLAITRRTSPPSYLRCASPSISTVRRGTGRGSRLRCPAMPTLAGSTRRRILSATRESLEKRGGGVRTLPDQLHPRTKLEPCRRSAPGEGVGVDLGVEQHLEGPVVLDTKFVVFVDVGLGGQFCAAVAKAGGSAQQPHFITEPGLGIDSNREPRRGPRGPVNHASRIRGIYPPAISLRATVPSRGGRS